MGENEDCSPGDSTSGLRNSSKDRVENVCIGDFGKGITCTVYTCFRKFLLVSERLLVTRNKVSPGTILSAFLDMQRYKNSDFKLGPWKSLTFQTLPTARPSLRSEHRAPLFCVHPELLSEGVENQQLQHMIYSFVEVDGKGRSVYMVRQTGSMKESAGLRAEDDLFLSGLNWCF